jgi:hypothetical protein
MPQPQLRGAAIGEGRLSYCSGVAEDPRAERVAANEGAFRAVNERVEEVAGAVDEPPEFVCECPNLSCTERLRIPVDEYERVRAHPDYFLVVPGHERPEFERVIDQGPGWLVVEKGGEAGERAAEDDPRGSE